MTTVLVAGLSEAKVMTPSELGVGVGVIVDVGLGVFVGVGLGVIVGMESDVGDGVGGVTSSAQAPAIKAAAETNMAVRHHFIPSLSPYPSGTRKARCLL